MHSCELITNLRAKKVLCHRIEVARISGATTTDCVFCNVIGYRRITPGKALSNQLNEDRGIGRRSPDPFSLERGRGLGTRLVFDRILYAKHTVCDQKLEAGTAWERGYHKCSVVISPSDLQGKLLRLGITVLRRCANCALLYK